jgi:hypothetical protein
MIELKVQCDCGQKYKFDVEPVNGRMPFTVACPVCGADGTEKANALIQQLPQYQTAQPAPVSPAPVTAPGQPKLRLSQSTQESPSPTAPPPISPMAGVAASAPPPITGIARPAPVKASRASGKPPSFAKGLLGALIGASVGAIIYFAIFKITGPFFLLRYVLALGVGGLAGWSANFLGNGEGSKELGGLAAVFTVVGILAAQYFLTLQMWGSNEDVNNIKQAIEDGGYAARVKEAKEVVKAIPTGSDAEIRVYLARQQIDEGEAPKLDTISNDEVKQFRETELTNYEDLAGGKLTKEAFWAKNGFDPKEAKKLINTGETAAGGLVAIVAVFKAGIIAMIAGAALAYKLSANA